MKNIHSFFNELKISIGAIWVLNDALKFSAPKQFQNEEVKRFIIKNKSHIMSVLTENSIFSKEDFINKKILTDASRTFYPLSPAQERLWFIEQYEQGTNAYHIPVVLSLNSSTNIEGMKYALQKIVNRHEVLRSTIKYDNSLEQGVQIVHSLELNIEEFLLSANDNYLSVIKDDINYPIDLSKEYPIKVKIYRIEDDKNRVKTLLSINIHHIASDGWSMDILLKEIYSYYEAFVNNELSFELTPLTIQYKDFAAWQKIYLTSQQYLLP